MMWQKYKGKYHLLLASGERVETIEDGHFLQTACQEQIQVRRKNQVAYPMDRKCGICSGVSRLINTSVDDARIYLKQESRLLVLYRALELTTSKTLKEAIERRIRKVSDVDESHSQEEAR